MLRDVQLQGPACERWPVLRAEISDARIAQDTVGAKRCPRSVAEGRSEKLVNVAARDGNAAGGLELVVRRVREVLDGHTSSFAVSNVATGRAHTFKDPATKPGREER